MRRTPVKSDVINSIGFENNILEIEFVQNAVYQYSNVPRQEYQKLMAAFSHGTYFNDHIKDYYFCKQIS
jgi:hypothetical protein